jgi:hypothetical protein
MSIDTAWKLYGPLRQAFLPARPAPDPLMDYVTSEAEIFPVDSEMPGPRIRAVRRQDHMGGDVDVAFVRDAGDQWVARGRDGNGLYFGWEQLNGSAHHGHALVECEPPTK